MNVGRGYPLAAAALGLSALLISCGGGGNRSNSTPTPLPPPNQAPTAIATSSATQVAESGSVTLDASGSTDPEAGSLTYSWAQTGGPTAQISSPNNAVTTVQFAEVDFDEVISFRVTVSDGSRSDTADISIIVQDFTNVPDANGIINISTQGAPVDVTPNLWSTNRDEFLSVQQDGSGGTTSIHYEVKYDNDGSIIRIVPRKPAGEYQGFDPEVEFRPGYRAEGTVTGFESSFLAIEPGRILIMHDENHEGSSAVTDPDRSKVYDVAVEVSAQDPCMVQPGFSPNPFAPTSSSVKFGALLLGYRNSGARFVTWPVDQPDTLSVSGVFSFKYGCGVVGGRDSSSGPERDMRFGFYEVNTRLSRSLSVFQLNTNLTDEDDNSSDPPISTSFERKVPIITPDGIFSETIIFSRNFLFNDFGDITLQAFLRSGQIKLQIVFTDPQLPAEINFFHLGPDDRAIKVDVVDLVSDRLSDAIIVKNRAGTPFYDASIAADYFLVLTQPDTTSLAKVPFSSSDLSVLPAVYQEIGLGAEDITELSPEHGEVMITFPDQNRIAVYQEPLITP